MRSRRRDEQQEADDEEERVRFKSIAVFDRSQVEPLPDVEQVALDPPGEPLTGDSHAQLLEPARRFAESIGFTVALEATPAGTGGWCDWKAKRIVIDESAGPNAQLRIAVHEIAHALGISYQTYTREQAEVIVETVTLIVCAGVGLETDGDTVPYVAGWGENGALDAITTFAGVIDATARRIESALVTE